MTYQYLPRLNLNLEDGNLVFPAPPRGPSVIIFGTASDGVNYQPFRTRESQTVRSYFGTSGTLFQGTCEAAAQRAENILVCRIGGTAASLTGIGIAAATGGYTVTTGLLDDEAGEIYAIYYDKDTGHLAVYNTETSEWVYDNTSGIDNGEVCVSGSVTTGEGADIGTASAPTPMADVTGAHTYTAGTDGTSMSRMEWFEALHKAYELVDFYDIDFVVPKGVYIDDLNIADMSAAAIAARNLSALVDYPTAGGTQDVLGKLFMQEYNGEWYFWWDTDNDGVAEIYPTVGAAGPSADIWGQALTSSDFHEVNFAYQLAYFCWRASKDWRMTQGFISFKLPTGYCLADLKTWIGRAPRYTTDPLTEVEYIASASDNGSGMLGNKWVAGSATWRGGVKDGGFIRTDEAWFPDGTELYDNNGHLDDIGKFINIMGEVLVHNNSFQTSAYISTIEASVAGLATLLKPSSAPTNKVLRNVRKVQLVKASLIDALAGKRIWACVDKRKGTTIGRALTAARPDSDYRFYTTVRIVKETIEILRNVADPFFGEGAGGGQGILAMQANAEREITDQAVAPGSLIRFDLTITATPQQFAAGQASAKLVLVPNFELVELITNVGLAAQ